MSKIIELVYASRATFAAVGGGGVEPEVARILSQSRRNNPRQHVGGVLCYRDGYFFQCLEGEAEHVEAVYRRITADARHQDVKILSQRPVPHRRFTSWSMKYAVTDDAVRQLLEKHGQSRFRPHVFGSELVSALVGLLQAAADAPLETRPAPDRLVGRRAPLSLAGGALGVAMVAMAVALVALFRTFD